MLTEKSQSCKRQPNRKRCLVSLPHKTAGERRQYHRQNTVIPKTKCSECVLFNWMIKTRFLKNIPDNHHVLRLQS